MIKWLPIQDAIIAVDKIIYLEKDLYDSKPVIHVHLINEKFLSFKYKSEKDRDEAFERILVCL